MPIIPRSERQIIANPTPSAPAVGDGGQIGRAVQGLGSALGEVAAKVQEHQDFASRIRYSEWANQEQMKLDQDAFSYRGDGTAFLPTWTQGHDERRKAFLSTLPDHQRQKFELMATELRGSLGRRALNEQQRLMGEHASELTLGEIGRTTASAVSDNPDSMQAAMAHVDRVLGSSPLQGPQRLALRQKAAALIVEAWRDKAAASGNVDALERGLKALDSIKVEPAGDAPSFAGQGGPASVRYNNPGAMYPGPASAKHGATGVETIGGGHKIAVFPDAVSGAAAQFELLSSNYAGMTVADAIKKWSGGNSVGTYLQVLKRDAGIDGATVLTKEMIADPAVAIPLAKAMATQEAGKPYPMSDAHWAAAHQRFTGGAGDVAMPSGQDQLTKEMLRARGQIQTVILKEQKRREGQAYVERVISGQEIMNPFDTEATKLVDQQIAVTNLEQRIFSGDVQAQDAAVRIAEQLRYVPKPIGQAVAGLIRDQDPKRVRRGYDIMLNIVEKAPHAFDRTPEHGELLKEAETYRHYATLIGSDAAMKRMAAMRDPDFKARVKVQEKDANTFRKELGTGDLDAAFKDSWLPWNNPGSEAAGHDQRMAMLAHYKELAAFHFANTGDKDLAKSLAASEMKKAHGVSKLFGRSAIMPYPPEAFYHPSVMKGLEADVKREVSTYAPDADVKSIRLVSDRRTADEARVGAPTYLVAVTRKDGSPFLIPGRFKPDVAAYKANNKAEFDKARETALERARVPDQMPMVP